MTEIAFLLDLVLNHKMSKDAKERCIKRIAEVESRLQPQAVAHVFRGQVEQAASTRALMDAHGATTVGMAPISGAVTVAAQAALQSREQAIAAAASGKPEAGRTSPRKF
jgi:hypothetical protein